MDEQKMAYPAMDFHGAQWRTKKRIPRALLQHYPGKTWHRFNTGEGDKKAAAVLVWRWLADLEEEHQRIRETGSPLKRSITPEEVAHLVRLMIRSSLAADAEARDEGDYTTEEGYATALRNLDSLEAETREAVARRVFGDVGGLVEDWLQIHGYDIPVSGAEFKALCLEFARGRAEAIKSKRQRNAGDWVDTPPAPVMASPSVPSSVPLLSVVMNSFLDKQDTARPMFKKYSPCFDLLLEVVGDKPVDALKQAEIDGFCAVLCKLPPQWKAEGRRRGVGVAQLAALSWPQVISPKTFEDGYVAALRPFLRDSARLFGDQGFPRHLTAEGIKYTGDREGGENQQRALRGPELERLYHGPEFAAFAADPAQAHAYWLPLIGLYTGARVNEVCQLNPQCDIREEGGIWFFDISEASPAAEGVRKRVKNKPSIRRVPLHSHLLSLGLVAYVARVKAEGSALLFPQWKPVAGKASGAAEKWFIAFLRSVGLRDETPGARIAGFHCFRSTFLNRSQQLDIDNAEWLTGHTQASVSKVVRGYKGVAELIQKRALLERITFNINPPAPATAPDRKK